MPVPVMRSRSGRARRGRESPLKVDLVSWWSLDEASDGSVSVPRLDSHGTNHLTDGQNADSALGKIGNAASFGRLQSERLTIADNASLQTGDIDFTIACWVRLDSVDFLQAIVAKDNNSVREYLLFWNGVSSVRFALFNAAGSTILNMQSAVGLAAGEWAYIVAWKEGGTAYIQINNGSVASAALTGTQAIKAVPFSIGAQSHGGLPFGGQIDEVAFWKRALTPGERTQLYNSGDGVGYSDI